MSEQLIFDLPVRAASGRDDFFVSQANRQAVSSIDTWAIWPSGKLLLIGPKGAGKTHLAHVWASDAGAQVIAASELADETVADVVAVNNRIALEDIDAITSDQSAQIAAFHLHNLTLAEGGCLLITANTPPTQRPMALPDLQSRLLGADMVKLSPPDDALLSTVMIKLFADRQVEVPMNVIAYLTPRLERSFESAAQAVSELDRLALSEKRPITRDLARRVMDKLSPSES